MQAQNVSPEERLLRLIESVEKGPGQFVFWDVRTWPALFSPYKAKVKPPARVRSAAGWAPRELNLKLINRGLLVLLVFLVAGLAWNWKMNRVQPSLQPSLKDLSSQGAAPMPLAGEEKALASLKPLENYLKEVEQRDLFNPLPPPKPEKPEPKRAPVKPPEPVKPPPPNPSAILKEKAKALKLVGISWGKPPIAMIEDTAKRETAFLKAGQLINDIQVKAILRDRAVLSYEGAEYELF